jgi:acyl-CoA synthetase (NDP forming)
LIVPELSKESQEKISQILPYENVNIRNPVDLGALGFVVDVFVDCINIVKEDPKVDILVLPLWPHFIYSHVFKRLAELQKTTPKPLVICMPSISDSIKLAQRFSSAKKHLHKNKILYYFNLRNAAKSLSLLCDYVDFLHKKRKFS